MTIDQYNRLVAISPLLDSGDDEIRRQTAEEVMLLTEVPYIEWEEPLCLKN